MLIYLCLYIFLNINMKKLLSLLFGFIFLLNVDVLSQCNQYLIYESFSSTLTTQGLLIEVYDDGTIRKIIN